jgi:hypothetical protein
MVEHVEKLKGERELAHFPVRNLSGFLRGEIRVPVARLTENVAQTAQEVCLGSENSFVVRTERRLLRQWPRVSGRRVGLPSGPKSS